jgi:prenyltransferase beta subunit
MKDKMITFLLKNANPSIKRRVKSEILYNLTQNEEDQYQEQILQEPMLQYIMSCQKENGWIGTCRHCTTDSTIVRLFSACA